MAELTLEFFIRFLIAVFLGILMGVEREHRLHREKKQSFGGVRTFTLIAILGALTGYLGMQFSEWIILAGIFSYTLFAIGFYIADAIVDKNITATTEVTSLIVYIIGVLCATGHILLGVISAIIVTLLLSMKDPLHNLVKTLKIEEIQSTVKFGIIAFIILPFLPNQAYGPLMVFNPYKIWLIVVLISGISFIGYLAMKFVGAKKGIGITGILGGFVSSTAVSMSMANASKKSKASANPFVFGMVAACTTMFFRVLVVIFILNRELFMRLLVPMLAMGIVGVACALFIWTREDAKERGQKQENIPMGSPFTLGPALKFALFFLAVLFIAKIGFTYFGSAGMYVTSLLSGLADVDAITVSVAELARAGSLASAVAVYAIVIAAMTNTAVKAGIANIFGSKEFRKKINYVFALILAAGAVSLLFI